MKQKMWTFKDAIAFVREKRPKICPNLGFERQLKEYEKTIFKVNLGNINRRISKTSEDHKHGTKKNIELPDIGVLGRTHIKSIVLDPFVDYNSANRKHKERRSEL